MSDQILSEIVSTPIMTVGEAVAVMREIDAVLPDEDGLKWFNFLYMTVTEAVLEDPPPDGWSDPA